jgi:hypothetical protein
LKNPVDESAVDVRAQQEQGDEETGEEARQWKEVFELTDEAFHPFLRRLQSEKRPVPEVGFEITINGEIVGEAELAWPDRQVVYLTDEQMTDAEVFENAGWAITPLSDLL